MKCKRCGAPTFPGLFEGEDEIICAPCERVLAEEREKVRA